MNTKEARSKEPSGEPTGRESREAKERTPKPTANLPIQFQATHAPKKDSQADLHAEGGVQTILVQGTRT